MNIEKWGRTRSQGKTWFLWLMGFVVWGLTTALTWSVLMHFIAPREDVWVRPLIALIVFPVVGLIWAHFVWNVSEKKFKKFHRQTIDKP